MIEFGALTGPLPKLGVIAVALFAAAAILARPARARALAILGALVLSPLLLLADIWHSPQLGVVHRHPLVAAVGAVLALALVALLSVAIARRPPLFGALAIFALPFRVPIEAGGTTSNLLVPLYLVVAAGSLAFVVPALLRPEREPDLYRGTRETRWVERLLALYVVLYGLQAIYSSDFEKALQQMVFFYVPFALLFCLLRALAWTPRLIRTCLQLVTALAVVFACIGFVEYATKSVFLNSKLVAANNVHTYFTVNSVFFDPDIFGRFLALVMILLAAVLLYSRRQRRQLDATAVLAILWAGLVLTLSRSSLAALLVGLATLAALRWDLSRAIAAAAAVVALGAAAIAASPNTFGLNQGLNGASAGRAGLVSGGIDLFGQRPLWGYGSGSFVSEYRRENQGTPTSLAASHTIAITIAAEQGLIGEVAYIALLVAAAFMLLRGARSDPARAAIAAAFLALAFHSELYADFLEDPVTWTLLGIGTALAVSRAPGRGHPEARAEEAARIPAPVS
ncbi:MAG: O-antigen ligase family protein [Solirubrobacterales bacterium]|nr:O-antigen ligase family protein [Solirubrobacterales bacterium]